MHHIQYNPKLSDVVIPTLASIYRKLYNKSKAFM